MSTPHTIADEAARLKDRFDGLRASGGITKAEFARTHRVPGGPSMLSQHVSGHRPISLEAAMAYAIGFGVPLEEISKRLATEAVRAASMVGKTLSAPPATVSHIQPASSLRGAFTLIADALRQSNVKKRRAIAELLASFARDPDDSEDVIDAVCRLLESPSSNRGKLPA